MREVLKIRLYRTERGECPILEFRDKLEKSAPKHLRKVRAAIYTVLEKPESRVPDLFKDIDDDLFQIRADPYRIICHLRHNPGILVLLDGVTKKAMKIPDNRRQRAIHYLKDYYERCLGDESEYEEQASF